MAISRFSTSTVAQGLPKYQKLWDGTSVYNVWNASDYESIATVTPGGSNSFSFTSIPGTYKHLQIRGTWDTSGGNGNITYSLNGTGGTKSHYLYGYGSGVATSYLNSGYMTLESGSGQPYSIVFDLLDYTSTSKYKTGKSFLGVDFDSAGILELITSYVPVSSAVTSITCTLSANNFAAESQFALYGIKG